MALVVGVAGWFNFGWLDDFEFDCYADMCVVRSFRLGLRLLYCDFVG